MKERFGQKERMASMVASKFPTYSRLLHGVKWEEEISVRSARPPKLQNSFVLPRRYPPLINVRLKGNGSLPPPIFRSENILSRIDPPFRRIDTFFPNRSKNRTRVEGSNFRQTIPKVVRVTRITRRSRIAQRSGILLV